MRYYIIVPVLVVVVLACKTEKKKTTVGQDVMTYDLHHFPSALYPVKVKGRWGYMNNKLEIVIQPQFQHAEEFSESLAVVTMPGKETEGNPEDIVQQGYIDTSGKIVIECRFDKASSFSEGLAVVSKKDKYGFIDKTGKEIIPLIYEDASGFSEGLAVVRINGKNGFIDSTGKMVIPPQFQRACWVSDFSEGLSAVYTSEDGPGGYIDQTGRMMIPAGYSYVGAFSEGLALVQPVGHSKYGYINRQGRIVIEPQYELSLPFCEGYATVKVSNTNGALFYRIIDRNGKIIVDRLNYAFTGIFREGMAGVESLDHRWGFIDKTGKEVIAPEFASVRLFKNGLARVETGSLFNGLSIGYVDKHGRMVWPR